MERSLAQSTEIAKLGHDYRILTRQGGQGYGGIRIDIIEGRHSRSILMMEIGSIILKNDHIYAPETLSSETVKWR